VPSALGSTTACGQEIKRAETGGLDFFENHEIERMGREDASEFDGLFRFASNKFAPQEKAAIAHVLTGEAPNELHRFVTLRFSLIF
jgi:hypothetical protein